MAIIVVRPRTFTMLLLLAPLHAPAQPCAAWFPFDGSLADASGNGYHGLLISESGEPREPQFADGKIGGALHVSGGNAMRAFLDLHYDACPQVTVTAWVRLESFNADGNQYLFSTGAGNGPGLYAQGPMLSMNATGNGIYEPDVVRDGSTWMFVAAVYDYTAGTYRMYWQGQFAEGEMSEHRYPPEDSLWVGTFNDSLWYTARSLYIDDLRVHDKALSADELRAVASGPSQ